MDRFSHFRSDDTTYVPTSYLCCVIAMLGSYVGEDTMMIPLCKCGHQNLVLNVHSMFTRLEKDMISLDHQRYGFHHGIFTLRKNNTDMHIIPGCTIYDELTEYAYY